MTLLTASKSYPKFHHGLRTEYGHRTSHGWKSLIP